MTISQELAKESAEELGVALTVPSDPFGQRAYWSGWCSRRKTPLLGVGEGVRDYNAGAAEAREVEARLKKKLGWRYLFRNLISARDLRI